MLSDALTKENLNSIMKDLAKEYKRLGGNSIPAEIVLIGGAAIIENYGFRDMTTDVDAIIHAASVMKDAANVVGEKYGLVSGWLNDDFKRTSSYTDRLREISRYCCTFSGIVELRTIKGEYLIAMKLMSGRRYKNDMSDIVGILEEHYQKNDVITYDRIRQAVTYLYGDWECLPEDSKVFIGSLLDNQSYIGIYSSIRKNEIIAREILVDFEVRYPGVTTMENVNVIIDTMREKHMPRKEILEKLRKKNNDYILL